MRAKFDTLCEWCGKLIKIGDGINRVDRHWVHVECAPDAEDACRDNDEISEYEFDPNIGDR